MHISVLIPDDLAARFGNGADLERRLLEAFGLAEYRAGRMTSTEVQRLLGFLNGLELDAFLNAHGTSRSAAPTDSRTDHDHSRAASDAVERSRLLRADKTLGSLDLPNLIREGRR